MINGRLNRLREIMMNGVEGNGNAYAAAMVYGLVVPGAANTAVTTYSPPINDKTAAMKCDSGLTYAVPDSRKRSRDAIVTTPLHPSLCSVLNQIGMNGCGSCSFLGEDMTSQIQQQQLEVDRFVVQHAENVRMEIEERRKRYSRRITAAAEENLMRKMNAKEEEIQKIGKLNTALEERVKVLSIENQIWRDLAQSNEAAANALRCNLEQVIAQRRRADEAASIDDAQSCCGETHGEIEQRTLAKRTSTDGEWRIAPSGEKQSGYMICRSCGEEKSCVLFLPCRHLCLCTVCGSSLHICPLCKSTKTASFHVNMC